MKGGISSRELGDAGQPSGGGAAGRIKGGDLERLLTHPSHPGPRSFAWTGRGLGEAGPAVSSRFHPQPHRHPPPDLRESDLSAPQNWDSPSEARTRPWRHCSHCSTSVSLPRTWRGPEVRRPQAPTQPPRLPNVWQWAWHAAAGREPRDCSLSLAWVSFSSPGMQGVRGPGEAEGTGPRPRSFLLEETVGALGIWVTLLGFLGRWGYLSQPQCLDTESCRPRPSHLTPFLYRTSPALKRKSHLWKTQWSGELGPLLR